MDQYANFGIMQSDSSQDRLVYDCFTFFNELDILELRLELLDSVVDRYVLVESPVTQKGDFKELFYSNNKERFAKFRHKIIHVVYQPPLQPAKQPNWSLENRQRDAIMRGLEACTANDIVLISDVDEIPDPKKILFYMNRPGIKVFEQQLMYYYLNFACWTNPIWRGTRMGTYADLLEPKQNLKPLPPFAFSARGLPTYFRFCEGTTIPQGGWHFSYCGGAAAIRRKKASISEGYDFNDDIPESQLEKIIKKGRDIHGRDVFFKIVSLKSLPHIISEKRRYAPLLLRPSFWGRIQFLFWHTCNMASFYGKKTARKLQKLPALLSHRPHA